ECSSRADRLTTPTCRSVAAATVDDAVADVLLAALTPDQVALALSAADEVAARHQRVSRAAELAVERARYDADRAERALCAVEPENRLVARSLEARWEARLTALAEPGQALQAAAAAQPAGPGETRRRPAWPVACPGHQRQGPQAAAAHPDRRRHPAARARPGQGTDRDPLAHRRHRRAPRGPRRRPRRSRWSAGSAPLRPPPS